ncbi:MAG: flavodoxin domain-containing protein [candidate division WOR-3 bacterium]
MKKVIVYYSKYGSTEDYARWIAEATGAELVPLAKVGQLDLSNYDVIVFGCPYYAFRLKIASFVKQWLPRLAGKKVAFFAVGGEDPTSPNCRKVYDKTFTEEARAAMRFWYFTGRITLARMGFLDRLVMKIMKAKDYDRTDRAAVGPLIEFMNQ